jgi:hypothetical protein
MGWGIGLGRDWSRGRYAFFSFWFELHGGRKERGSEERNRRQEETGKRNEHPEHLKSDHECVI